MSQFQFNLTAVTTAMSVVKDAKASLTKALYNLYVEQVSQHKNDWQAFVKSHDKQGDTLRRVVKTIDKKMAFFANRVKKTKHAPTGDQAVDLKAWELTPAERQAQAEASQVRAVETLVASKGAEAVIAIVNKKQAQLDKIKKDKEAESDEKAQVKQANRKSKKA